MPTCVSVIERAYRSFTDSEHTPPGPGSRKDTLPASRGVHDEADADKAYRRPGQVPAVRTESVQHHPPGQRAGDENATVGGEYPAEVGVGLQGRDEPVRREGRDAESDPPKTPVFTHALPDQPCPADLGDRGHEEQKNGLRNGHAGAATAAPTRRAMRGPPPRPRR